MNPVPIAVRRATAADRAAVVDTIVRAFRADPLLRFLAPTDEAYARIAPAFFGCLFDLRVAGGGEVRVSEDLSAASLWNPPGGNRLGEAHVQALWSAQVEPLLGADEAARMDDIERVLGAMHPEEPHWYLGVVAVRPERHGAGLGGAVIRALLAEPQAQIAPAFLITASAGNLPVYERLGFVACVQSNLPRGPHLWGMRREASA